MNEKSIRTTGYIVLQKLNGELIGYKYNFIWALTKEKEKAMTHIIVETKIPKKIIDDFINQLNKKDLITNTLEELRTLAKENNLEIVAKDKKNGLILDLYHIAFNGEKYIYKNLN